MEVDVYRSRAWPDTYVYLPAEAPVDDLPEALLEKFKNPEPFLRFELTPERALAQTDPQSVMSALDTQGFYLQLPPTAHPLDAELSRRS